MDRTRRPLYPWADFVGDPADELQALRHMPPAEDEPAGIWVRWHERHIACWERIAARDAQFAQTSAILTDCHRRKIKDLMADPDSPSGRTGYWEGPSVRIR